MARLILFTGSGISAESGIPTFRGGTGLWDNYKIDDVCDGLTWKQNYDLVHEFYNKRRMELGRVKPNAAHLAIADWQKRYETIILTQNVDDLLERAGCKDVVHLHGYLTEMHCTACGYVWDIGYTEWKDTDRCNNFLHKCNSRKGVKPNVVFFNESAPKYADFNRVIRHILPDDVVVVMGTSGIVIPIDSYLFDVQAYKILNNLEPVLNALGQPMHGTTGSDVYNKEIFAPSTVAVKEIDEILKEKLG